VQVFVGYPISGTPPTGQLFAYSTPFKLILNAGAQFFVFGAGTEATFVTGYLVDQP
jgi:hypothetical protein